MTTLNDALRARNPLRSRGIPKGARCDAYTGWHPDAFGAPVIERCKNLAVRVVKTNKPGVFSELWLCASCRFEEFEGKAVRVCAIVGGGCNREPIPNSALCSYHNALLAAKVVRF